MYSSDSFLTLSLPGQVGLVAVSLALSLLVLGLGWWTMGRVNWAARFVVALAFFFAFVWLSPQVYYTYYLALFDGLPWQTVIKKPPDPGSLLRVLSFQGPQTLSAHSLGLLGWALVLMAVFRRREVAAPAPDDRV